ncbi:MAG TPA: DUF2723 domain-containing protein [Longimicrobium sp.]|jgi:hypothetical protein
MSQAAPTAQTTVSAGPPVYTPAATRPPYLAALAAAAAVFALYAITLGPTTWFWDTSEYIATAHIMGIPHPPGNPLFVLLARAWEVLLSPFGLTPAVRVNLFSAFMTAGTMFFWYLVVHRILTAFTDRPVFRHGGAAVSVLISATAYTVWSQATVNEKVYTVSLFTIGVMSWVAFLWRDQVESHAAEPRQGRGKKWHDDNALVLIAFVLALSVGNHLMAFLAAPALAVFFLMVKPQVFANWRVYAFAALFGLLGLSAHLYLPIRSNLQPVINEAAPSCPNLSSAIISVIGFGKIKLPGRCPDLHASLARDQYQKPPVMQRQAPFTAQMSNYFQYFDWQWARSVKGEDGYFGAGRIFITMIFLALGGFGALEHYRRDRKSFAYIATLFFTLSVGLVYYMNFKYGFMQVRAFNLDPELSEVRERDYFFLVSFSLWGLWAGIGLAVLWQQLAEAIGGRRNSAYMAAPVLLLGAIPLVLNCPYASRRNDYTARDFAYNMLQSVEPYGVLFTNGDNDTFPLWYVQEVEGVRRDVTVIVLSYLNTDWYAKQLRDITKPCTRPGQADEDPTRIICQRPFDASKAPRFYDGRRVPTRTILPLTDDEIRGVMNQGAFLTSQDMVFEARGIQAVIPAQRPITPADQFLLTMVKHAWGDRPFYFAGTTNVQFDLNLYPHVERQGMVFKLVNPQDAGKALRMPEGQNYSAVLGAYLDPERNRRLVEEAFEFHGVENRPHWTDDATRNIPMHYFYALSALAVGEDMSGRPAEAQRYKARAQAFQELSNR